MSLRCSVQIVTAKDFINYTAWLIISNSFIKLHCSIAIHVGRNVLCTHAAAISIVRNFTASEVYLSILLDDTALTATIGIIANSAARDIQVRPYVSSVFRGIIGPVGSVKFRIGCQV